MKAGVSVLSVPLVANALAAGARLAIVPLAYVAAGTYYYRIKAENGYTANGKFVITR